MSSNTEGSNPYISTKQQSKIIWAHSSNTEGLSLSGC
jgi:hypothetical protein